MTRTATAAILAACLTPTIGNTCPDLAGEYICPEIGRSMENVTIEQDGNEYDISFNGTLVWGTLKPESTTDKAALSCIRNALYMLIYGTGHIAIEPHEDGIYVLFSTTEGLKKYQCARL